MTLRTPGETPARALLPAVDDGPRGGNVLAHIGRTPLVRLNHFDLKPGVQLYAKLEGQNPTGSVKDRVAYGIVRAAIEAGALAPGQTIIEASTGNTGIALAMIGRQLGHPVRIIVPENVFPEIGEMLAVYGAEILWVSSEIGIRGAREMAHELARRHGYFMADQFGSPHNARAHYETTAAEILADMPHVDLFVAGLGTGGTIMGVGQRLKEVNPLTKVIAVEPHPGNQVQGLKSLDDGFIPPILDLAMLDGRILARSRHAFNHAYELIQREGIFGGVSAGAVLHAALRFACRISSGTIVCLFADAGWKYLGTRIWSAPDLQGEEEEDFDDIIWW
ncbi:MAG: PLP-dependent cysteine synthase family protein [Dehalococcoidia bacterium]